MPVSKLSDKQRRFVLEYMKDLNATQAAIRAGYGKKGAKVAGHRLLTNVNVQSELNQRRNKQETRTEITSDFILYGILDTVQRCRQAVPVVDKKGNHVHIENEDGELVPAYTFNALGALKGFELLGRHKKLFTDKVEHSGAVTTDSGQRLAELLSQASERADNLSQ